MAHAELFKSVVESLPLNRTWFNKALKVSAKFSVSLTSERQLSPVTEPWTSIQEKQVSMCGSAFE